MAGFLGGFDPSLYAEHQASNTAVNSASLVTLMSVTGKGMLEEALIVGSGTSTTNMEIVITIDGIIVLDLTATVNSGYNYGLGVVPSTNIIYMTANFLTLVGVETLFGAMQLISTNTISQVTFPNSSQVTCAGDFSLVGLEQPIYFNQSLLIQIKGAGATIKAGAKARY